MLIDFTVLNDHHVQAYFRCGLSGINEVEMNDILHCVWRDIFSLFIVCERSEAGSDRERQNLRRNELSTLGGGF